MNELQITNLEKNDITTWNFEQLKMELKDTLSVYETTVYTDATIKMAKEDKAKLNKAKKVIEDRRKEYKAKCLAPYEAIEAQVKEVVGMIEEQRTSIDSVVKDFTDRQKAEKEKVVRAYYDKKSFVLGNLADDLYEKILDPKWLNASTSKNKMEVEIQMAIYNASDNISAIKEMQSPFEKTLIETYVSTFSMDDVRAKNTELMEAMAKSGLEQQVRDTSMQETPKEPVKINHEEGTMLKVYATQGQLNLLMDFMKAIGVNYEVQ